MGSGKSDDEQQAQLLQDFVDLHGPDTQQRLGELAILAQVNDMVAALLDLVNAMTKDGLTLSDKSLRTQILQAMRRVRDRSHTIENFVPRTPDKRRDTTIPPKGRKKS